MLFSKTKTAADHREGFAAERVEAHRDADAVVAKAEQTIASANARRTVQLAEIDAKEAATATAISHKLAAELASTLPKAYAKWSETATRADLAAVVAAISTVAEAAREQLGIDLHPLTVAALCARALTTKRPELVTNFSSSSAYLQGVLAPAYALTNAAVSDNLPAADDAARSLELALSAMAATPAVPPTDLSRKLFDSLTCGLRGVDRQNATDEIDRELRASAPFEHVSGAAVL